MIEVGSSPAPTILLVDDDLAVLRAMHFSLELEGYLVDPHASAETLAARDDFPAKGCLVVDYNLPGMDGLALLACLRSRLVRLPAILITSNPGRDLKRRAVAAGVAIVEKPLLGDALTDGVRTALDGVPLEFAR